MKRGVCLFFVISLCMFFVCLFSRRIMSIIYFSSPCQGETTDFELLKHQLSDPDIKVSCWHGPDGLTLSCLSLTTQVVLVLKSKSFALYID